MNKAVIGTLLPFLLCAAAANAQDPPGKRAPRNWETAADGTVTVRGSVVFTDVKHEQHAKVRGHAKAILWFLDDRDHTCSVANGEIDIDGGAWCVTFANPFGGGGKPPTQVTFSSCRIDDVPVIVETEKVALTDDAEFVLRLRAIPTLRLRAVDAETKRELDGVEVFCSREQAFEHKVHPGLSPSLQQLAGPGKSPLAVEPPGEVAVGSRDKLWVRAPAHAWQPVDVLFAEGGTREVALPGAGALTVTLAGKLPAAARKVAVRLYRGDPSGAPVADFEVIGGSVGAIESLAPGDYVACLEVGDWYGSPAVLARASMTIEAGKTAELRLDAKEGTAAPARFALRGRVVIPPGWHADPSRVCVSLRPVGETQRWAESLSQRGGDLKRGDKDGEYRFDFDDVVAGHYAIEVWPCHWQQALTVAADGELLIEAPEPVEVVLRVVDENGKPRNGAMVAWSPEAVGLTPWCFESVLADAGTNVVRIVAAGGAIQVRSIAQDYLIRARTLRVGAKDREFEVAALTLHGVQVAIFEAATRVPLGSEKDWQLSLRTLDGKSVVGTPRGDTIEAVEAGTYLLCIKAPSAYQPVPDRQVKLSTSPFPTIEVKVARK